MTGITAILTAAATLTVSVSPTSATGEGTSGGTLQNVTTNSVTATPSVTGTYTYEWLKSSGDDVTINSPSSASTTFSKVLEVQSSASGYYFCRVTTEGGFVVDSPLVFVQISRFL